MTDFCHLHAHSFYSLLDGLSRPEKMAQRASELGQSALALTDHGTMYGAIQFYKACKEVEVKPLVGCEVYVAGRSHTDKDPGVDNKSFHLVLLAKDEAGYKNLMKLTTLAHIDGFYYKPRVDHALLAQYGEGLVCLSGCMAGELPQAILNNNLDRAKELITLHQSLFKDFFLEVQHHPNLPQQQIINDAIMNFGNDLNIPVVATNDSHYVCQDDADAQDTLLAIQTQAMLADESRMSMMDGEYSLATTDEMQSYFADTEVITNTLRVAELCDLEIKLGQARLPKFSTPAEISNSDYLRQLCEKGVQERYPITRSDDGVWSLNSGAKVEELPATLQEIVERLEFELETIERMGYDAYFLIVWDVVRYARENGVVVGPGRGSAAGSLVIYALRITDVDPLKYDLLFERFLNPDRISMPDIDIDFDDENRDVVIQYVRDKYGHDCVASIIVFGTMAAKASVKDVARVMGLSYDESDKLAKMIPGKAGITLEEVLESEADFKDAYDNHPTYRRVIELAMKLEGVVRHASVHACAVVISEKSLTEYTPLQWAPRGDQVVISQYGASELEELGLLKMDFLGLRNLTVIKKAVDLIEKHTGERIDPANIPLDDRATYRLLGRGDTTAVFQLESGGMKRYLRELRPSTFEDVSAMIALYRPGPMASIPKFIARKHGRDEVKYDHPLMEAALHYTYGVTVYQEQVMQISREMAGFTRGEADTLRKAMGKKDREMMQALQEKFINGSQENGVRRDVAEKIWTDWDEFARYAFNKSHTAAYGMITYQTAYLKANYPAHFMAATLSSEMDKADRIGVLLDECRQMGVSVLPPEINESETAFAVVEKGIRFGLGAVKNVGGAAIQSILDTRAEDGDITSLHDFCRRVNLQACNRRTIESLIRAGTFESVPGERAQLLNALEGIIAQGLATQQDKERGQTTLFGGSSSDDPGHFEDYLAPLPDQFDYEAEKAERLDDEKTLLGFYVSGHPLDPYRTELNSFITHKADSLAGTQEESQMDMGGIITAVVQRTTKKGEPMANFTCQDFSGSFEAVVFPKAFSHFRELVAEKSLVFIRGVRDKQEPKILVNELHPLAEIRSRMACVVHIHLNSEELDDSMVKALSGIVSKNGGRCSVLVHVATRDVGEITFKVGDAAVEPGDDLLEEIEAIPAVEKVWLSESTT